MIALRPLGCAILGLAAAQLTACAGTHSPGSSSIDAAATSAVPRRDDERASAIGPPDTERRPVTDRYHGVAVVDDYRWLEDGSSPAVSTWSRAQNAYARRLLDALPGAAAVRERVGEVLRHQTAHYIDVQPRNGVWFVLQSRPPKQQAFLVVLDAAAPPESARVLVDPTAADPTAKTSIDWFQPSPDAKLVAVSLSRAGTEMGDLIVVDVATGELRPDAIARVNGGTAGGDLAWTPDSTGFYYTRYPRPGERPAEDLHFYQKVYFHRLGESESKDRAELGEGLPKIAEIQLDVDPKDGRVLATVQNGDGGEFAHYVRDARGTWRALTKFGDKIEQIAFGNAGELFILSRRDAPRGQILRLAASSMEIGKAQLLVPETEETLVTDFWDSRNFLVTSRHFYALRQLGGPTRVAAYDLAGRPATWSAPLDLSATWALSRGRAREVIYRSESFIDPPGWYRFDEQARTSAKTALVERPAIDLSRHVVVREFATSKDGTRVPLNIVLPPGVERTGDNACVVTGYGGYGSSLEPSFRADTGLWTERGVVFVVANLRGGGEYGEQWHRQGNLENKQNVFDDFHAVLRHVVARRYTRPERLGIIGGSNGGLLMGATLTQHPEAFKAAVSFVGIYDMLRVERSPNGAFNVTEFGTVENPGQFAALHAYSPYHRVRAGVGYPSILFITGENDPRVEPWHSRKMTAALQAAAPRTQVLLRTSAEAGHGSGTALDERIAQKADAYAFLFAALGVNVQGASH